MRVGLDAREPGLARRVESAIEAGLAAEAEDFEESRPTEDTVELEVRPSPPPPFYPSLSVHAHSRP